MGMSPEELQRRIGMIESNIMTMAEEAQNPWWGIYRTFSEETVIPYRPGRAPVEVEGPYAENAAGALLFKNGVIANPLEGTVYFPPAGAHNGVDPEQVAGSPQWLARVQREWTDEKVGAWRKRLSAQGYQVASEGGMAYDLIDALRQYHSNRYTNLGQAIPLTPEGKGGIAASVRDSYDKQMIKETVKGWGEVIWDEPLDDDVADWWADRQIELAVKMAKNNPEWTLDQVQAGAELRAQREFSDAPGVKGALKEAEQLEGSTKLRDSMVSLSQVTGI